jgi:hypothetical protein
MTEKNSATPKERIVIGVIAGAAGAYFLLVGVDLLPAPGGPGNLHGPFWLVLCIGLAFFLAAVAIIVQAFGRANDQGELPAEAPYWMRVAQYLIGVAIFVSFGAIGSWIAFGPGARTFYGSVPLVGAETNAAVGRMAFGIGAVITWLCTIAFAVAGARKLFGQSNSEQE